MQYTLFNDLSTDVKELVTPHNDIPRSCYVIVLNIAHMVCVTYSILISMTCMWCDDFGMTVLLTTTDGSLYDNDGPIIRNSFSHRSYVDTLDTTLNKLSDKWCTLSCCCFFVDCRWRGGLEGYVKGLIYASINLQC